MKTEEKPNKKILLIDRNEKLQQALQALFRKENYQVEACGSGREGARRVRDFRPDLILLNVQLSDCSGLELCSYFKRTTNTSDIPVFMIGNVSSVSNPTKVYEVGAIDYIERPYSAGDFYKKIRKTLNKTTSQWGLYEHFQNLNGRKGFKMAS